MIARWLGCLAALCVMLFLACWIGTGTDEKDMRSFWSYPEAARDAVRGDPRLAAMIPKRRPMAATFIANLVLFTVALALAGLVVRPGGFGACFRALLAMGEALGLFDLVVIDLMWWRRSPRPRFSGLKAPEPYQDPRPHLASFARGIPMLALAALLASLLLRLL